MNYDDMISPVFFKRHNGMVGDYKIISYDEENFVIKIKGKKDTYKISINDLLNDNFDKFKKKKNAKKRNLEVKIQIDSRERDLKWITDFEFDTKFKSDKIMISSYEQECFKAESAEVSTGDVGILIRFEGEKMWRKTTLSVEIKRGADLFGTLFMAENVHRFHREIDRSEEYGLTMYFLHDWDFIDVDKHIKKLQRSGKVGVKTRPDIVFRDNYIDVSRRLPCICCGGDFAGTIRRIIKNFIKNERLNYETEK